MEQLFLILLYQSRRNTFIQGQSSTAMSGGQHFVFRILVPITQTVEWLLSACGESARG